MEKLKSFFSRQRLDLFLTLIASITLIATLASFFATWDWRLDLFSHFRIQLLIVFSISLLLALALRSLRPTLLAGLGLILQLTVTGFNFFSFPASTTPVAGKVFTAVQFNLYVDNDQTEKVLDYLSSTQADILALQEYSPRWDAALKPLRKTYPYVLKEIKDSPFGIAFYSRFPLKGTKVVYVGRHKMPTLTGKFLYEKQEIGFVVTHPYPPVGKLASFLRNEQLEILADLCRDHSEPFFLVGDLNISPWCPYFRRLLRQTGLQDSREGFGIQATWPTMFPWLKIPIDHFLMNRSIRVLDRSIGPFLGSDHLPVILRLAV